MALQWLKTAAKKLQWEMTPQKRQDEMLAEILLYAPLVPDVQVLLHHAQTVDKVTVGFDASLIGTQTLAQLHTVLQGPDTGKISIRISPESQGIAGFISLAHELRHHWQNHMLGTTAEKRLIEERDPVMSLLTTRVKEADAFAYESDVQRRLFIAIEALDDATALMEKEGAALTEQKKAQLSLHFNNAAEKARTGSAAHMQAVFTRSLEHLAPYDSKQILRTHAFHTSPAAQADDFAHLGAKDVITPAKLRAITLSGVFEDAVNYLPGISDKAFADMVLAPVAPDIMKTAHLMKAFDAAKAANDNKKASDLRRDVADRIRKIRRSPAAKSQ